MFQSVITCACETELDCFTPTPTHKKYSEFWTWLLLKSISELFQIQFIEPIYEMHFH